MKTFFSAIFFVKYFWHIIIVLIIVIFSVSYFGLAKPKLDLLKDGQPLDTSFYLDLVEKQKKYLTNLKSAIAVHDNLNFARLEKLDQLIGAKKDFPNTLAMIVRMLEKRGIVLGQISLGFGPGETVINISISGKDYFGFKEFLKDIEHNSRLMDLRHLDFSPAQNSYSLQLVIYHLE